MFARHICTFCTLNTFLAMLLPHSVAGFTFFLCPYLRDSARCARFKRFSMRLIAEDLLMFLNT